MAFDTSRDAIVYADSSGVIGHAWIDGNYKFGVPSGNSTGIQFTRGGQGGTKVSDILSTTSIGVALNLFVDSTVYPGTPGSIMLVRYVNNNNQTILENWTRQAA